MFEKAGRLKLRFQSPAGSLSVEDLWDIPLTSARGQANLDDIAKTVDKAIRDSTTTSFVTKNTVVDETNQLRLEILKHIIEVRVAENEAKNTLKERKEKRQQILGLIANKENEQLAGSSIEELRKLVESLS